MKEFMSLLDGVSADGTGIDGTDGVWSSEAVSAISPTASTAEDPVALAEDVRGGDTWTPTSSFRGEEVCSEAHSPSFSSVSTETPGWSVRGWALRCSMNVTL